MKKINSFFKALSREEIEAKELVSAQKRRRMIEEKERQESELNKTASTILTVIDEVDDSIVNLVDHSDNEDNISSKVNLVGDSVISAVERVVADMGGGSIVLVEPAIDKVPKKKRNYNKMPSNWTDIADYYATYKNIGQTIRKFGLIELNPSREYWTNTLWHWKKMLKANPNYEPTYGQLPFCGVETDNELAAIVKTYFDHGVPMTNLILKMHLVSLLTAKNRADLLARIVQDHEDLKDKHSVRIGKQWCQRFYERHKLSSRVATTKMRDCVPKDYEEKKDKFMLHLSKVIHEFNVPLELIVNADETNTQFVPTVQRTRCPKGTRRVRIIGIGHEKPQITVTLAVNAVGDIIEPTQLIFGGKTNQCHPNRGKTPPLPSQYYDHTQSHWQTAKSFLAYLSKVIFPYRCKTISRLNLVEDQKLIFLLDLHYSHRDEMVLELIKLNHVIPVFIPAGCTDLHQVCDLVLNKPYKNGVTEAFVDYVSSQFNEWLQENENNTGEDKVFKVNLAGSVTKPLIPQFVLRGVEKLKTPDMSEAIKNSFQNDSLLSQALLEETYQRALTAMPTEVDNIAIPEGVEEEEDLGPHEREDLVEDVTSAFQDISFDIEVNGTSNIEPEAEPDGLKIQVLESNSSSDSDDFNAVISHKRVRKPNSFVGEVKKGKYSR